MGRGGTGTVNKSVFKGALRVPTDAGPHKRKKKKKKKKKSRRTMKKKGSWAREQFSKKSKVL